MGVVSLIFGILAVILCWIPGINIVGVILGVLSIVLGAVGKSVANKKGKPTGVATAGLVLGIIATAIALGAWLACSVCAAAGTAGIGAMY